MTHLLDTHAIVWAGEQPQRLSLLARTTIDNPKTVLVVSAASAWEVATKVRKGTWPEAARLEANFTKIMETAGFQLLSISFEEALRAGRLIGKNKDPFDRMIAAQAIGLDIPVISVDRGLDVFGVRRIW